jgi:histidinol-phosphatase (PHP family)
MVLAAIDANMSEIGFSVHAPLPFRTDWAVKVERLNEYKSELCALRERYKEQIKIYIGIEQDYFSENSTEGFDYVIGSVHHVESNGRSYGVDASKDVTRDAVMDGFGGDVTAYYKAYFEAVSEIYEKTHCDIIGHFDLIAKFSELDPLISESDPEYIRLRDSAIDALLETPAVFEVNTGAISRGYRTVPYPHPDVLERIKRAGKPVIVTSDTHAVSTLDFMINETAERLLASGIKVITSMDELLEYTRK